MKTSARIGSGLLIAAGLVWGSGASALTPPAADAPASPTPGTPGLTYKLTGNLVNLSTPSPVQLPLHLSSSFGLLPHGQELMLTATPGSARLPDWLQSMFPGAPTGVGLYGTRATYRYTFLESDTWAWKVGLTANLASAQAAMSPAALGLGDERWRMNPMPMMHLSGSGRLGDRWTLSLDADSLHTTRGRALDLDLQVDYGLGRDLSLFGGYRMIETGGDVEDLNGYGAMPSNTANVGIRFRF